MHRRESTNVKLAAIINSKSNDKEEELALINEEKKAMQRLRRSSLYGGGARTKIPKIKKQTKIEGSPYQTLGAPVPARSLKPFDYSVPPGAHSDQFRIVKNPTQLSLNDPDRVCINSTSMMEDLQVMQQPPWYFGNNNKVKPADGNHFIAANRYGYRGARAIQQFTTQPWEIPSKTRTEHTPTFLDNSDEYINEWVPPIMGAKIATINGIETPKLWPENTEYTTGYPLKKYPKSWVYKRETTVDIPERPVSPESLSRLMSSTAESHKKLKDMAHAEMTRSQPSIPMTAQADFEAQWKNTLSLRASGSLRHVMKREKPIYEPHTLMDPSDTIKYSGSTALIVHTQTSDELQFRLRMEQSKNKSKTPFQVKWQHVGIHYSNIQNKLKRGETMKEAIRSIAKSLRRSAMRNGSETSMRRIDFIQACQHISYFEEVTPKQLSLLYSLFDPMKKNSMRFVELVGLLAVLDCPDQLPYEKLQYLWKIHYEFGLDRNIFDIVLEILSCCAYSVRDLLLIEDLFKSEFRPKCYELSISGADHITRPPSAPEPLAPLAITNTTSSSINGGGGNGSSRPGSRPGSSSNGKETGTGTGTGSSSQKMAVVAVESDDEDGAEGGGGGSQKRSMSVQPQYNICEHFLDHESLLKVFYVCPQLIAAFDAQLSGRLIGCHGKDDRYLVQDDDSLKESETHDFSWIMKRQVKEREVFGLF